MHRIYQSRLKLTASIAAATKAEEELIVEAASATAGGTTTLSPLSGETQANERKRHLEDVIDGEEEAKEMQKLSCSKISSPNIPSTDGNGHCHDEAIPLATTTSLSPPHKKAAILRSPETKIPSPTTCASTSTSTPTVSAQASETTSGATQTANSVASITPTNNGDSAAPANSGSNNKSTLLLETATVGCTVAPTVVSDTTTSLSPNRTIMEIDLITPPPPPQSTPPYNNNNHDATIHPEVSVTADPLPETTTKRKRSDEDAIDDEIQIVKPAEPAAAIEPTNHRRTTRGEEENDDDDIQVVSSTTVNPNVQYPHKRTDCGVFSFSKDPSRFCDKCYCVVCDIPAKDCTSWGDHASEVCRPVSSQAGAMTDDEGYDVTDEILLESPTTTARDYYRRQNRPWTEDGDHPPHSLRDRDDGRFRREELRDQYMEQSKLRIVDVLSQKLRTALLLSEGGRSPETDPTDNHHTDGTMVKRESSAGTTIVKQQKNSMEGDISELGLHASFFVEGIKIGWPFPEIMRPQRLMAMHIVKGLKRKLHVVLESPTGTGKSVAILCSVLAWQRYHVQTHAQSVPDALGDEDDEEKRPPRIIYCSRTHSQVTQMVASLKKTPYRPTMTVLASRERMCIHKGLTGKNKKTNLLPINMECQNLRRRTEHDRRTRLKDMEYDDNDPIPPEGEIHGVEVDEGADVVDMTGTDNTSTPRKRKPGCPHYRQLTSERTASMAVKQFMGGHRIKHNGGCCGNSLAVGGEESTFGVHDIEDLLRFGKNPYEERRIAVYRGKTGKFGFLIDDNRDAAGEPTRGSRVISLVEGGSAEFEARLQSGDKILRVNGKDVRTLSKRKVVELLGQTPKDRPARLDVLRDCSDTPELLDPKNDFTEAHDTYDPDETYSEHSICPYYLSRAIQAHAELTFAPYNYILDPGIRRAMNISLKNAVVVLDEAHNVESTLCEGGSGKYGEMDLFQLVCTLNSYARRTAITGNITLINLQIDVDTAKLAHDLLLFVENIILHLQALRQKFETSPGRQKLEDDYKKYRNTPDNHEVELSYDGPTGYGIKGTAVGCQPFLTRLDITKEKCERLHEFAASMEQTLFGGKSESEDANLDGSVTGESSNVLTTLVEMLSKLVTATENPEHYYIACVVQANGNLDHAFGLESENPNGRFKKKPRQVPFMSPRSVDHPNAYLNVCQHEECKHDGQNIFDGVRHGEYCDGSTPPWECHLVLRLLSPGLLMREISQECRSVVLASGSLAPLESVCAELNLFGQSSTFSARSQPEPDTGKSIITGNTLPTISQSMLDAMVKGHTEKLYTNRLQVTPKPLEADHVVDLEKQLLAVSIGHFPSGEKLTVSYSNYHSNPSFVPKFGHAIAAVIEGVPKGGCLVFFPSYSFLKKCVSCWNQKPFNNENTNSRRRFLSNSAARPDNFVWNRFLRSKGKVIVEPTGGQEEFEQARDEYKDTIRETGSCILLAVFRGKMSEGIDFNDENARAVICIGMPLPNWKDRSVKAKQAYNDEQRKLRKKTCLLPGRDFYNQQAYRAIAQALGRCIRHGADYGTVILMDSRHCHDGSPTNGGICRAHEKLPKWMRRSVRTLSMDKDHRMQGQLRGQPRMIYGGYGGLKREMRQFFERAPITSREVRDKWKSDKEKAASASSSHVVFHRDTGNWTTVSTTSSGMGNPKEIQI